MDTIQGILNGMMREALSPQTAAVAIAVIGLNIHFGFTGLLNMGQAGFMLLGAYGMAISVWHGLPFAVGILFGLAAALVFALVLGVPTLKLRGDYLAIVTISAAEILRYVGRSSLLSDFTGAAQGIPGSQYNSPVQPTSRSSGSGSFTLLPFNYLDVADGAAWVRILGWLILIGLIAALVYILRGGASLSSTGRILASIALGVLGVLLLFFLFPVPNQVDRRQRLVGPLRRLGRWSSSARSSSSCWSAAPGAGSCAASARTRTRSARSARTSSRSRCRRSSSAACSARSAACSTCCRPAPSRTRWAAR